MTRAAVLGTVVAIGALTLGVDALAQEPSVNAWSGRGLLHLGGGYVTPSTGFAYRDTQRLFREEAKAEAAFDGKGAGSLELGGGVRIAGRFGVGASLSSTFGHQDARAQFSIPNPFLPRRPAVASFKTSSGRQETAVHLQAIYLLPARGRLHAALFSGPSYFTLHQDLVSDATGDLSFDSDGNLTLDLSRAVKKRASASAWGFNVGGDVAYLLTRTVGVGGLVRFSRATIGLENALEATRTGRKGGRVPVTVGGLQLGAELRFRF